MVEELVSANRMFNKQGSETVLLGCSIEPDAMDMPGLREDMERYSLITPRESITYDALISAGVSREKVIQVPDPAFSLKTADIRVPEWLADGNTVGLNLSPMLEKYSSEKGISFSAFSALIRHILDNSDMDIALVPHVVRSNDDDTAVLKKLMEGSAAEDRIHLVEDMDACALKAVISRCRFFVGARTHATIAAYSSRVPTLVAGYSVKSKGIARDLFGTEENYVLPVQKLEDPAQLVSAFEWLRENEENVAGILARVIPDTVKKAGEHGKLITGVLNGAS